MGHEETAFTSLSFETACEHAETLPPRRRWQLYPPTDDEYETLLKWLPPEALEDPKVARYLGWSEKERAEQKEGGKVLDKVKEELGYPLRADEAERTVQYLFGRRACLAAASVAGELPAPPPQDEESAADDGGGCNSLDTSSSSSTSSNNSSSTSTSSNINVSNSNSPSPSALPLSAANPNSANLDAASAQAHASSSSSSSGVTRRSSRSSNSRTSATPSTTSSSLSPAPPSASGSTSRPKTVTVDHLAVVPKKPGKRLYTAIFRLTDWPDRKTLVRFGKEVMALVEATEHLCPDGPAPFDLWLIYRTGSAIACVEWIDGELRHKLFWDIAELLRQTDRFFGLGHDFLASDRPSLLYHAKMLPAGTPFIWGYDGGNKKPVWRFYFVERVIRLLDGTEEDVERGVVYWTDHGHARRIANAIGVSFLADCAQRLEVFRNEEKGRGEVEWEAADPQQEGPGSTGRYWELAEVLFPNPEGRTRAGFDECYSVDVGSSRAIAASSSAKRAADIAASEKAAKKAKQARPAKKGKGGLTAEEQARRCPFGCPLCYECDDVERMRRDDESECDFNIRHLFEVHLVPELEGEEVSEEEKKRREVLAAWARCPTSPHEACRGWKRVEKTEAAVRKHCKEDHQCWKE